jgi:hypothetical protein
VIIDDLTAEEYADFIDDILASSGKREILREAENWTKEGELIRVIDYLEPIDG